MQLTSNSFQENGMIPTVHTCDGPDRSPHLAWSDIPGGTASFAITCIDPDSPSGNFVHWLVYNIPSDVTEIPEDMMPNNAKVLPNDFGVATYGGPCPAHGKHRYVFTLFALDELLTEEMSREQFFAALKAHQLGHAQLVGLYERKGS